MIKVGAAAINQTPLDWNGNKSRIISAIKKAQYQDISILCLPELAITGYGCEDAFYSIDTLNKSLEYLQEIIDHTHNITTAIGLPISILNKTYNAVAVVSNRQILGFVCKQHLPNYGVFYEDRWFHRWPSDTTTHITINGINYPVGDLVFDISGVKIGVEICEDAWVANRPGTKLFNKAVDFILNPSASPFTFEKFKTRERLVIDASRTFCTTYIYTNLLGNESGKLIFDGDAIIASGGELIASSDRFSYEDITITSAYIDIQKNKIEQSKIKSPFKNDVKYIWSNHEINNEYYNENPCPKPENFENGGFLKEEEFARAISLGLFDYLRKSRSNGFTISLSGGADSSACAALCYLMIQLAEESIGLQKIKQKLAYIPGVENIKNSKELSQILITTIYQGTQNSSTDTFNSAKFLAEGIGADFLHINIDELVSNYTQLIENQIGRSLTWVTDDIPLQNIQARVRAPSVWLVANIKNHLLLTTSNRSEAAVGYCTMDGDTAGSISPISGIDKSWLRNWLVWLEKKGCEINEKHITIEALKYVNGLQPTAELRPSDQTQTDEKDLMPYPILNKIENLGIRDKKSPLECFKILETQNSEYKREDLFLWINRFFKLWSRNQWKRERYAAGFHLDSYNLDPKSWCRFPVLNGGFEAELQDLKDYFDGISHQHKRKIGF